MLKPLAYHSRLQQRAEHVAPIAMGAIWVRNAGRATEKGPYAKMHQPKIRLKQDEIFVNKSLKMNKLNSIYNMNILI